MQNKTKTVKIFKFSVLNYPYLVFVVLSKQQLTTSFSVLRRCYQIKCVQILLSKAKFTKGNFGNTGPKRSIAVIVAINYEGGCFIYFFFHEFSNNEMILIECMNLSGTFFVKLNFIFQFCPKYVFDM